VGKDDAALDGVYKLSMYDQKPRVKISDNIEKILLPGVKKVYRYYLEDNTFYADAVVLDREDEIEVMHHPHQPGKQLELHGFRKVPLLSCVMEKGDIIAPTETPYEIAERVQERFIQLPAEHKRFEYPHVYKVGISEELKNLRDTLVKVHSK
jgi:nicotinate phosphoribosyltransferase